MTQERRFEIEEVANRYDSDHLCIMFRECLAEIDRLTAERNQLSKALDLAAAELEAQTKEIDRLNKDLAFVRSMLPEAASNAISLIEHQNEIRRLNKVVDQMYEWTAPVAPANFPELAAELERRAAGGWE